MLQNTEFEQLKLQIFETVYVLLPILFYFYSGRDSFLISAAQLWVVTQNCFLSQWWISEVALVLGFPGSVPTITQSPTPLERNYTALLTRSHGKVANRGAKSSHWYIYNISTWFKHWYVLNINMYDSQLRFTEVVLDNELDWKSNTGLSGRNFLLYLLSQSRDTSISGNPAISTVSTFLTASSSSWLGRNALKHCQQVTYDFSYLLLRKYNSW